MFFSHSTSVKMAILEMIIRINSIIDFLNYMPKYERFHGRRVAMDRYQKLMLEMIIHDVQFYKSSYVITRIKILIDLLQDK